MSVWRASGPGQAVVGAAVAAAIERFERELPRARTTARGVHQARVAARRLRSHLRTFEEMFDPEWSDAVRDDLKWVADALGGVRDIDVLEPLLARGFDETGIDSGAAEHLLGVLGEHRVAAVSGMIDVLDDERTAALVTRLHTALDPPTRRQKGRTRRNLRARVAKPWRRLVRAVEALDPEPPGTELHQIRIRAKRVRYAAEAVTQVFGAEAEQFASSVEAIQEVLGDLHDAEVAADWLRDAAVGADPDTAAAADEVARHFDAVARSHHHGWEQAFANAQQHSAWLDGPD